MLKKRTLILAVCLVIIFSTGCARNTITVTNTVFPSLTPELTEVSTATSLPATDYPSEFVEGSYVAVAGRDPGSLFLVDVKTGTYQTLEIQGETGINLYGWSKDLCGLIVGTESNRILQVDIHGNIRKELLNTDELDFEGHMMLTTVLVSPDENWLSFLSGTGQQGYSIYEFQDLVVVSVQDQEHKIYQLTTSGSVNGASWKPDGSSLAYNDVDNHGGQQVFVSNPDGSERLQLTHFDKEGFVVKSLQWSPAGDKLAFLVSETKGNTNSLTVVDASSDNGISIEPVAEIKEFWWSSDNVVVASILETGQNNPTNDALVWHSAVTGEELGRLDAADIPDGNFALPGPLRLTDKIGFFSQNRFYVYDISFAQLVPTFNQFTDMRYWISAPEGFDQEDCRGVQ